LSLLYWPSLATLAGDASLGSGPDLAAQAIKAGLVDECHLFGAPILVGGGKQSLPNNVRLKLELVDERRLATARFTSTTAPRRKETATLPGRLAHWCP